MRGCGFLRFLAFLRADLCRLWPSTTIPVAPLEGYNLERAALGIFVFEIGPPKI